MYNGIFTRLFTTELYGIAKFGNNLNVNLKGNG
jgi:hypothetical protein